MLSKKAISHPTDGFFFAFYLPTHWTPQQLKIQYHNQYKAMLKKGSKLYSILNNKCPRCHEGQFYTSGNPYKLKQLTSMPEACDHCGQKYKLEPAFYFGATYVSYALSAGVFMVSYLLLNLFFEDLSLGWYFGTLIGLLILLMPPIYKLSRITWINFFVKYKGGQ